MAEPIEEFLEQAAVERKPLSEQEKKEAMAVAHKVWVKAMERVKEIKAAGAGMLVLEDPLLRKNVIIYDKESAVGLGLRKTGKTNTDLVIAVVTEARDKEEGPKSPVGDDMYYFVPNEVVKVSRSIKLPDRQILDKIYSQDKHPLRSELLMSEYQRRLNEQRVEKLTYPDKRELTDLLNIVSSAKAPDKSAASLVVQRSK